MWLTSLVRGYGLVTVLVVANLAFSGLLVSWVMKFADSIMKARPRHHAFVLGQRTGDCGRDVCTGQCKVGVLQNKRGVGSACHDQASASCGW